MEFVFAVIGEQINWECNEFVTVDNDDDFAYIMNSTDIVCATERVNFYTHILTLCKNQDLNLQAFVISLSERFSHNEA